jgi:hypothetical protein
VHGAIDQKWNCGGAVMGCHSFLAFGGAGWLWVCIVVCRVDKSLGARLGVYELCVCVMARAGDQTDGQKGGQRVDCV